MFTIFFKFGNKRVSSEIGHVDLRSDTALQFSARVPVLRGLYPGSALLPRSNVEP